MTTKVGPIDGDALISKLEELKMKAAMWAGKESKVAVGEKQTCEVLIRLMHEGRFALKPEASQDGKWEKRWKLLEACVGKCGTEEMAEKMAELEAQK